MSLVVHNKGSIAITNLYSKEDAKRLKEGRGLGFGSNYSPFIRVEDVPSLGKETRVWGWKAKRIHHLLSQHETSFYYIAEWSPHIIDIQEQFPLLPIEETLDLAQKQKIRHISNPKTKEKMVVTTDFLLTLKIDGKIIQHARSIKPAQQLLSKNTLAKLEVERCYWAARGVSWAIVTELDIPQIIAQNAEILCPLRDHQNYRQRLPEISDKELYNFAVSLTKSIRSEPDSSLTDICSDFDSRFGLAFGSALTIAQHLIATGQWGIDIRVPFNPRNKFNLLSSKINEECCTS